MAPMTDSISDYPAGALSFGPPTPSESRLPLTRTRQAVSQGEDLSWLEELSLFEVSYPISGDALAELKAEAKLEAEEASRGRSVRSEASASARGASALWAGAAVAVGTAASATVVAAVDSEVAAASIPEATVEDLESLEAEELEQDFLGTPSYGLTEYLDDMLEYSGEWEY